MHERALVRARSRAVCEVCILLTIGTPLAHRISVAYTTASCVVVSSCRYGMCGTALRYRMVCLYLACKTEEARKSLAEFLAATPEKNREEMKVCVWGGVGGGGGQASGSNCVKPLR
jgi:hypothetical protein